MTKVWRLWMIVLGSCLVACAQPQASPSGGAGDKPAAPKFGGTLTTHGDEFRDFDVSYGGSNLATAQHHGLVYDRLVRFKKGPGVEYVSQVLEGELAERWEVSSDARVFTYHLRKGAKFAKLPPANGRELTSADVKWTFEYYSRTGEFTAKKLPLSQREAWFEGLEGIDTPDRHTVRVRFKDPFIPFLNYSASQWMPIVAPESFSPDSIPPKLTTLVGTGPYIYDEANSLKDSPWIFKRNPDYWGGPLPYLDAVRRLYIPDESTKRAAFQARQLDILGLANYAAVQDVQRSNPEAIADEALNPYPADIFISQRPGRHPALSDIRVRKAIALAIDRDEFNNTLSGGKGAWALNASWPGLFTDAEIHQMHRYDPTEAKRLLAEAGYANGMTLEAMLLGPTAGIGEQLIQAQLKRVGIDAPFKILSREESRARLYVGDFDLVPRSGGGGSAADADFDAHQLAYHSTSPQNWSVHKDPELDKLILAQRREADPEKRRQAQRAVVKRIHEMSWNTTQTFPLVVQFQQPYVKNYRSHFSIGQAEAFAWLDK